MANLLWHMDIDTAIKFYEEKEKRGLTTEAECVSLLAELAREGRMKAVIKTNRSKEKILEDLSREHNILKIEQDGNE